MIYGVAGVLVVTWLGIAYWIYSDARSRAVRAAPLWAVASAFVWPVGVYYVLRYHRTGARTTGKLPGSRGAMLVGASGIVSIVVAEVLSSPDGITMGLYLLALFPTAFVLLHFTSRRYREMNPR